MEKVQLVPYAPSLRDLADIARDLGIPSSHYHPYGPGRGKIDPRFLTRRRKKKSLYVLVSGMTPTPAGEGKTTTSIGLSMGIERLGLRSVVTLRQPSMGPVFGIKGGGSGGGRSTIEPSTVLNLHLTGDIHAVAAAHNLLAAGNVLTGTRHVLVLPHGPEHPEGISGPFRIFCHNHCI